MYSELALYIDGKWLNGEGRKGEDVINPATGKTLAHLPHVCGGEHRQHFLGLAGFVGVNRNDARVGMW